MLTVWRCWNHYLGGRPSRSCRLVCCYRWLMSTATDCKNNIHASITQCHVEKTSHVKNDLFAILRAYDIRQSALSIITVNKI